MYIFKLYLYMHLDIVSFMHGKISLHSQDGKRHEGRGWAGNEKKIHVSSDDAFTFHFFTVADFEWV